MTLLHIELREQDGFSVAVLEGEIDVSNTKEASRTIQGAVSNADLGCVIDLSGVRYVDSSGVSMFFEISRHLRHRRQQLGLSLPDDSPLRRLIDITNLKRAAVICPTVEDCIETLRSLVPDS